MSKQRRESCPSQSLTKSSQPFNVVHSNIWGLLNVPNFGKFKYYVIFVDDHSQMTKLCWLKDKSEVFFSLQKFVIKIKTQFAAVIKVFRSENALECMSTNFQNYCHNLRIIHETSCTHTPNQNGVAERNKDIYLSSHNV